jgi:hypothetical protein
LDGTVGGKHAHAVVAKPSHQGRRGVVGMGEQVDGAGLSIAMELGRGELRITE